MADEHRLALDNATSEFAKLLEELKALASADRGGRRTFLLYTALPILDRLTGPLKGTENVAPLSDLVRELTALKESSWGATSDARFDELWDRALQVLGDFVQPKPEPRQGERRSFWKRPR